MIITLSGQRRALMGGNFRKEAKPEGVDEYSPRKARNVSLGFDDLPPSTPRAYASSASKTTATVDSAPKQEEMAARTAVTSEEGTPDHDSGAEDEGTGGNGGA